MAPELRDLPYPLGNRTNTGAIIAISSDADDTSMRFFRDYHSYINSFGYSVGDSFFGLGNYDLKTFLWNILKRKESAIRLYGYIFNVKKIVRSIRNNEIDSLHSFAESDLKIPIFIRTRIRILDYILKKNKVKIDAWVDHSQSTFNFGDKLFGDDVEYNFGSKTGDVLGSKFYHTDISIKNDAYGICIKFAWHHYSPFNPRLSLEQNYKWLNESQGLGSSKLSTQDILIPSYSKDNRPYFRFIRLYNSYYDNNESLIQPNNSNLSDSINKENLDLIAKNGHYSIIATHLGTPIKSIDRFKESNNVVFELLREYKSKRLIHVTTTSRLLNYAWVKKYMKWHFITVDDVTKIFIVSIQDHHTVEYIPTVSDLTGITFYVDNPARTEVYIDNNKVSSLFICQNESDGVANSISIGKLTEL